MDERGENVRKSKCLVQLGAVCKRTVVDKYNGEQTVFKDAVFQCISLLFQSGSALGLACTRGIPYVNVILSEIYLNVFKSMVELLS
jgi:hypothetical protein